MNAKEIIVEYLRQHGYDGLFNSDAECGCIIDELIPCEDCWSSCEPGYICKSRADLLKDTSADWVIGPQKEQEE